MGQLNSHFAVLRTKAPNVRLERALVTGTQRHVHARADN